MSGYLPNVDRRTLIKATVLGGSAAMILSPGSGRADEPKGGGTLKIGLKGGATTDVLDPTLMLNPVAAWLSYQYGNRLLERKTDGSLVGELAESWEAVDGAARWTFSLRKDVVFHNGKQFVASDMAYSLDRHRAPGNPSGAAAQMANVDKIETDGDFRLTIVLKQPDFNFPYLMSDVYLVAQPKGETTSGVGTGPYAVVSAEPGKRYLFRRNEKYFKRDAAWADDIEVLIVNDDTARVSALMSGSVDMVNRIPPKLVKLMKGASSKKVLNANSSLFYYFGMRCDTKPFDNPDLRLALKYAVDRQQMLQIVLAGYGAIGNDSSLSPIFPLYPKDIPQHGYDPDKASYHFKKSGHSGPVTLHTADEAFPGAVDASLLFQQSAGKAGIQLEVKREPSDGYWSDTWGNKPFYAGYWGSLTTEDRALSTPYLSTSPQNDAHWVRPDFDKLLENAPERS